MKELEYSIKTGEVDTYGFKNSLNIRVIYNEETSGIDLLSVNSYNQRKGVFTDLTDIFKSGILKHAINKIDWAFLSKETDNQRIERLEFTPFENYEDSLAEYERKKRVAFDDRLFEEMGNMLSDKRSAFE